MNILALLSLFNLTGNVWSIISHALPIVMRLVKDLEGTEGLTGKEKAAKVFTDAQAILAEDGVVINEKYDYLLNLVIELALVILREGKPSAVKSITVTSKPSAPTGGHH